MNTDVDTVVAAFKTEAAAAADYQTERTITVNKDVATRANEVLVPALIEQKKTKTVSMGTGVSTKDTIGALKRLANTGTYTDNLGDLGGMYQKMANALSARRPAVVTSNAGIAPLGNDRWDGGRNISGKRESRLATFSEVAERPAARTLVVARKNSGEKDKMHTRKHRAGRRQTRRRGGKMKMSLEQYDVEWNVGHALAGDNLWKTDDINNIVSGKTNIKKPNESRPGSVAAYIRNKPQVEMVAARRDAIKKAIEAIPGLGAVSVLFTTLPLLLKKELDASYPQGESEYSNTPKNYFSSEFFDRIEPAKEIDSELIKLYWDATRNSYPELADVAETLREQRTVSLVPRQVARLSTMLERIPGNAGFKEFGQASSVKSNVSPSAPKSTMRSIVPGLQPGADGTFSMVNPLAKGKTAGRKLKKRSRRTRRH